MSAGSMDSWAAGGRSTATIRSISDPTKPTPPQITLGLELEFLVPDTEPEDIDDLDIDHHPRDPRWFLRRDTPDEINKAQLSEHPDLTKSECVQVYLADLLQREASVPALFAPDAKDPECVNDLLRAWKRKHPHRRPPSPYAVAHSSHQIWTVTDDPTVHMPCEHPLYEQYGWHSVELVSPIFTSLPALRADVDTVCATLRRKVRTTVNETTGVHIHAAALKPRESRMSRVTIKRLITLYCMFEEEHRRFVAPWRRGAWDADKWCKPVMKDSAFFKEAMLRRGARQRFASAQRWAQIFGRQDEVIAGSESSGSEVESDSADDTLVEDGTIVPRNFTAPDEEGRDDDEDEDGSVTTEPMSASDWAEEAFAADETIDANVPPWIRGSMRDVLAQVWAAPTRRQLRQGLLQNNVASENSVRTALALCHHGSNEDGDVVWTAEFRMAQGSLDPELIARWAEVVGAHMRIATLDASEFKEMLNVLTRRAWAGAASPTGRNPRAAAPPPQAFPGQYVPGYGQFESAPRPAHRLSGNGKRYWEALGLDDEARRFWSEKTLAYEAGGYAEVEGGDFLRPLESGSLVDAISSLGVTTLESVLVKDAVLKEGKDEEGQEDETEDDSGYFEGEIGELAKTGALTEVGQIA